MEDGGRHKTDAVIDFAHGKNARYEQTIYRSRSVYLGGNGYLFLLRLVVERRYSFGVHLSSVSSGDEQHERGRHHEDTWTARSKDHEASAG